MLGKSKTFLAKLISFTNLPYAEALRQDRE